jgi:hypothetical protein
MASRYALGMGIPGQWLLGSKGPIRGGRGLLRFVRCQYGEREIEALSWLLRYL